MYKFYSYFKLQLHKGSSLSVNARKNIITSFVFKGLSIIISFLLVPLTLNYLGPYKYGIWLTLGSIITWFNFFDIGLANGFRNNFTKAIATKNTKLAKIYVSTIYAILIIISISIFFAYLFLSKLLSWDQILNAPPQLKNELTLLAFIILSFFLLKFVLKIIGTILIADQKPSYNDAFNSFSSLISLITIYIITITTKDSLLLIGIANSISPIIILSIATYFFFKKKYKYCKPSISHIKFKYFKILANLGIKFFIIQIAGVIIFTTDNIIITQILGASEVTTYQIAYKYFSIPIMIFSIFLSPYWSAFTYSYHKNDIEWIKTTLKKIMKIAFGLVALIVIMIFVANFVYRFWIGDVIKIPVLLSISMALYSVINIIGSPFTHFLNGIGKIKLQLYVSVIAGIINIPLSIYFAKNMGSSGVILATCLCTIISVILWPIQYKKIINNSARGIWEK